jgi:hypothetical protein
MGVVMKIIDKGMGSAVISIAIYLILFSLLPGCGEFNDNPRETEMKLTVDISELKKQFGYSSDSDNGDSLGKEFRGISGPGDSEATSAVESLVIGAIVITARDTPYTTDEVLTDKDMEDIEDDVLNSAAYIDFVNLRTTEDDTVEFTVPPPGAGNWQVAAIGVDFKMEALIDLDRDEHDDAVMYYGFTPRFYSYDDIEEDTVLLIEMKRNCLANEDIHPNGCATYSNILNDDPIVTPAVEIVDVKINDASVSYDDFPIIVRSEADADAAISILNDIKDNYPLLGIRDYLTVITTHSLSPLQTDEACKALADNPSATVEDLKKYCEVQTYKVPITE